MHVKICALVSFVMCCVGMFGVCVLVCMLLAVTVLYFLFFCSFISALFCFVMADLIGHL